AADTRAGDLFECMLRIGPAVETIERKFIATRASLWERLGEQVRTVFREKGERVRPPGDVLVLQEGVSGISIREREDGQRREISLSDERVRLHGNSRF